MCVCVSESECRNCKRAAVVQLWNDEWQTFAYNGDGCLARHSPIHKPAIKYEQFSYRLHSRPRSSPVMLSSFTVFVPSLIAEHRRNVTEQWWTGAGVVSALGAWQSSCINWLFFSLSHTPALVRCGWMEVMRTEPPWILSEHTRKLWLRIRCKQIELMNACGLRPLCLRAQCGVPCGMCVCLARSRKWYLCLRCVCASEPHCVDA